MEKNANDNSLTNLSHTANFYPSYVLTDKYLKKIKIIKIKKTYCHDNDKKYFRNIYSKKRKREANLNKIWLPKFYDLTLL